MNAFFVDRRDAARALAGRLSSYKGRKDAVVLAVPRGGVVIGAVLASELGLPLDVILTKKIGHPNNPEFAIGAVSLTGSTIDSRLIEREGLSQKRIQARVERIQEQLWDRYRAYRGGAQPLSVAGKTVILADDGAATGRTLLAAVALLRRERAHRIVTAIPVAPPGAVEALKRAADEAVCLEVREDFLAISESYADFSAVSDEEAMELLKTAYVQ